MAHTKKTTASERFKNFTVVEVLQLGAVASGQAPATDALKVLVAQQRRLGLIPPTSDSSTTEPTQVGITTDPPKEPTQVGITTDPPPKPPTQVGIAQSSSVRTAGPLISVSRGPRRSSSARSSSPLAGPTLGGTVAPPTFSGSALGSVAGSPQASRSSRGPRQATRVRRRPPSASTLSDRIAALRRKRQSVFG